MRNYLEEPRSTWGRSKRTRLRRRGQCVALLVGLLGLTHCKNEPFAPSDPGLHILSGESTTDTILTLLRRPLVVQVVDADGRPAAGTQVRFDAVPMPRPRAPFYYAEPRVYLTPRGRGELADFALVTTDGAGRASIGIWFNSIAGEGKIAISVPALSYTDTARFDIQPGAFVGVDVTPEDTAVYAGQSVKIRGRRIDAMGNPRDEPVTLAVKAGPATLDVATGVATVSAIGRVTIVASVGALSDTAWISGIPRAELASLQFDIGNGGPIAIRHIETNGTVLGPLIPGFENDMGIQGWEWTPDGQNLVIARGQDINFVTPGGSERTVFRTNGGFLPAVRLSRDGAWIYYTEQRSAEPHRGNLRVRIDGTDRQPLGQSSFYGFDRYASPSHDGRSIVYTTDRSLCYTDICIQVLDLATNQDRVYSGPGYFMRGHLAAWSPVEDLIAVANGPVLTVLRSDRSGARTLATDLPYITWMDWSPDGRWLVVAGYGPLVLFDVHTGMRLPIGQLFDYGPAAWRP